MKTNIFAILAALMSTCLSAYAIAPKVEVTPRYLKITDVERTDSTLRIGVRLQHYPNYWVRIPSSTHLMALTDTTTKYKIKGAENFALDEKIWMPASGQHEGVLIFERVPEDVKIVDMIESSPSDAGSNALGIHLDEPDNRVRPDIITLADVISDTKQPTESWKGFNPKRYADMSFYKKDGTTHLRGRITDYSQRAGFSTFSVKTNDDFAHHEKVNVGEIHPDGSFEIDLPVSYPQISYIEVGPISNNLFLIPGDTLSLVSCMATVPDIKRGTAPEFFGYEGDVDDGVAINILMDSILNEQYSLTSLFHKYYVKETDSMESETYKTHDRLAQLLDSVITDRPTVLGDLPISGFAKDILSDIAIAKICERMEDLEMNFVDAMGPGFKKGEDGSYRYSPGKSLDYVKLKTPILKHKDLIYNNPLILCSGFVLPNRWEFNQIFRKFDYAGVGMVKHTDEDGNDTGVFVFAEDLAEPYKIADNYLDSIGIGDCFVAQLVNTNSLIRDLHSKEKPSFESLDRKSRLLTHVIKHNEYGMLNDILMGEYNNYVKDVMVAENILASNSDSYAIPDGTPRGETLKKIIAPYEGNVFFLDFWGIGCGPCRAGMMNQKSLLEKLSDKPFKALYIANAEDGLDACKNWLKKEDIKGEHIFVSGDEWKLLSGLFNFSGIPFGVLISKDGKIIKREYSLYGSDPMLEKALDE